MSNKLELKLIDMQIRRMKIIVKILLIYQTIRNKHSFIRREMSIKLGWEYVKHNIYDFIYYFQVEKL